MFGLTKMLSAATVGSEVYLKGPDNHVEITSITKLTQVQIEKLINIIIGMTGSGGGYGGVQSSVSRLILVSLVEHALKRVAPQQETFIQGTLTYVAWTYRVAAPWVIISWEKDLPHGVVTGAGVSGHFTSEVDLVAYPNVSVLPPITVEAYIDDCSIEKQVASHVRAMAIDLRAISADRYQELLKESQE